MASKSRNGGAAPSFSITTAITSPTANAAAPTRLVTAANARFVRRFGQRNALIFTLLAAAYGTTVLHFTPLRPFALFVLYTWSALLGTVLGVQFWMFAGQRFTVTQGKRLF